MDANGSSNFREKLAVVFEVETDAVQPDFSLEARWDSVAVLTATAMIDQEFGVTVPVEDLTRCKSVAELLTLVEQAVRQRRPAR